MIYVFLANGFEEIEALSPIDLLRRAGLAVTTVGVGGKEVVGSHEIKVIADIADCDFSPDDMEMIILPGGMPGTKNLDASSVVHNAIKTAVSKDAYIGAICAAPMILGKLGLLNGRRAVCYPGFEEYLEGGAVSDSKIAIDGKFITAKSMGVAVEFGLAIVEELIGTETAERLRHSIIAD